MERVAVWQARGRRPVRAYAGRMQG